jgi:hypothetical protein
MMTVGLGGRTRGLTGVGVSDERDISIEDSSEPSMTTSEGWLSSLWSKIDPFLIADTRLGGAGGLT